MDKMALELDQEVLPGWENVFKKVGTMSSFVYTNAYTYTPYLKQHLSWGIPLKNEDLWHLLKNQRTGA